jgi:hypothetical protein
MRMMTWQALSVRSYLEMGPTSHTFEASEPPYTLWGYTKFIELAALNESSHGHVVDDTLIIKCEISSNASAAGAYTHSSTVQLNLRRFWAPH